MKVGVELSEAPHAKKKPENKRADSFEDLLKHAQEDARPTTADPVRAEPRKKKKINYHKSLYEVEDENLGDDFEATPWLPPSLDKAMAFKNSEVYANGDGRLDAINIIQAPDLGTGVTLYFSFAMNMAIALCVMSVLSLPSLVMIYSGTGVAAQDRDALGLYRYTLGNIGYNPQTTTYAQDSKCTQGGYPSNTSCIHFGNNQEISLTDAGAILTAMEFLQVFVFFVCVMVLQGQTYSVQAKSAKTITAISDYSIMVKGIPPDTTQAEIVEHFNKLYPLDKVDYRGRPPLEGAVPVQSSEHNKDDTLIGTWIAECVLHKAIGSFISSFKDKQHVTEKLYRCRAKMKMYAENSSHAGGHNLPRFLAAEKEMIKTGTDIDKLTALTIKRNKLKIMLNSEVKDVENGKKVHKTIYSNIDAPTVAAFICFEYCESFARCIQDYDKYQHFPYTWLYPNELKFRGHKIYVQKAPEPDQIVWENLEVTASRKRYLRTRTGLITAALVILCFIIILQASIYKEKFSSKIPSASLCKATVPELFNDDSSTLGSTDVSKYDLYRPPSASVSWYDKACQAKVPETFYAVYSKTGFSDPVVPYNISTCFNTTSNTKDMCPTLGASSFCPCVSIVDTSVCSTAECTGNKAIDTSNEACETFDASAIGSCFCYQQLANLLDTGGVAVALNKLAASTQGNDPCFKFYKNYSLASGLTYLSIVITTAVNYGLRVVLLKLAKQEAHASVDHEQGSIMAKVFMSNFANMAIIVLVAYGSAPNLPQFFKWVHIFDGAYADFDQGWYGNVGFYFMTTFLLQSFSPLASNLFQFYIWKPLQRFYHHRRVLAYKSYSIVMQNDLNMLQVGEVFDATTHTAQLLTLLFFAMAFAPGLPLLMPLCCFAFVMYFRIDKMLLCRFFQKRPQIGDGSIRLVLKFLPYAALIRLAFALWMFSAPSVFPHEFVATSHGSSQGSAYLNFIESQRKKSYSHSLNFFRMRVLQANTFPLFVAICALVAVMLVRALWHFLPAHWIITIVKVLYKVGCTTASDLKIFFQHGEEPIHGWDLVKMEDPNRQEMAPFTGYYFRYLKHKDEIPDTCMKMFAYHNLTQLSELEVEEGWGIKDSGDFVYRIKFFKENTKTAAGKHRKKFDEKKTYEVIGDHRCNTYNIEKVPAYRMAMKGLREGTNAMAAEGELDDDEDEVDEEGGEHHRKKSVALHLEGVMENYNKHEHMLKKSFEAANAEAVLARDPHSDVSGDHSRQSPHHTTSGGGHHSGHRTHADKSEDDVPQNPNKRSHLQVKAPTASSHTPKSQASASYSYSSAHSSSNNSLPASTTPGSTGYKYNFDAYEDHAEEDAILDQQYQAKKKEKKTAKKDKAHKDHHQKHHHNSSGGSGGHHNKVAVDYGDNEADYQAVEGNDDDYNAGVSGLI